MSEFTQMSPPISQYLPVPPMRIGVVTINWSKFRRNSPRSHRRGSDGSPSWRFRDRGPTAVLFVLACFTTIGFWGPSCYAQVADETGIPAGPSGKLAEPSSLETAASTELVADEHLNLLWLIRQGGVIMVIIGLASIVALALIIELLIRIRASKILPRSMIDEISDLAERGQLLDPRRAYQICQNYPCAASRILRAALLKVGRPHQEIEQAIAETSQREADRMHQGVRWLNLLTAVTPLLGLLGTVWGMIRAFYDMTQLTAGQNKATFLAAGIYTALVTTLGGLAVAIPSAVAAHFFEGRILAYFHRVQEFLGSLIPQWESLEGKVRVTMDSLRASPGGNGDTVPHPVSVPVDDRATHP